MKRPSFQFYPADWRKDAELMSCSIAAQGLWINVMCIAHECEPYGHLTVNGKPMTTAQLARLAGVGLKECEKLVRELEESGAASRSDDGALLCRRMVRDERLRNVRAEGGKGGSVHGVKGAEHGKKGGRPRKERGVKKPPLEPPPSSSSSSSASTAEENASHSLAEGVSPNPPPPPPPVRPRDPLFDAIAEVAGLDPATAGGQLGKVRKTLAGADPPYTPDDVREFGRRFWELCPWAAKDPRPRPTAGEIEKYIGGLRAKPPPPQPPTAQRGPPPAGRGQSVDQYAATLVAGLTVPDPREVIDRDPVTAVRTPAALPAARGAEPADPGPGPAPAPGGRGVDGPPAPVSFAAAHRGRVRGVAEARPA